MLAGLTLVPALCALAGQRILPRRDRPVLANPALAAHGPAT